MEDTKAIDALKPKQRVFVLEYLKDRNATQAAIRAGYAEKNANVTGPRMLVNVGISAALKELEKEQEERTLVTADYVITALKDVAERCLEREPVMVRRGREVVQEETNIPCDCGDENCKGTRTVGVWKFDSAGANKALELLGKYKKLFSDRLELPDDAEIEYTVKMKT